MLSISINDIIVKQSAFCDELLLVPLPKSSLTILSWASVPHIELAGQASYRVLSCSVRVCSLVGGKKRCTFCLVSLWSKPISRPHNFTEFTVLPLTWNQTWRQLYVATVLTSDWQCNVACYYSVKHFKAIMLYPIVSGWNILPKQNNQHCIKFFCVLGPLTTYFNFSALSETNKSPKHS